MLFYGHAIAKIIVSYLENSAFSKVVPVTNRWHFVDKTNDKFKREWSWTVYHLIRIVESRSIIYNWSVNYKLFEDKNTDFFFIVYEFLGSSLLFVASFVYIFRCKRHYHRVLYSCLVSNEYVNYVMVLSAWFNCHTSCMIQFNDFEISPNF